MTSGTTAGIEDDDPPSSHQLTNTSIFDQLGASAWRSYMESMPSNCVLSNSGLYAVKHNPAAYFTSIRAACAKNDLPLPSKPSFAAKYTFVAPNLCNDTHDCPVSTGDRWLKSFVPRVLASKQYRSGSLVLFLTHDEDDGHFDNHIATIVVGPTVPRGARVSTRFTHYSLLRTLESILRLPCLANACTAGSMRAKFRL
jgi:phospholipase C